MKLFAVVFAGVPGTSKTIIANYLSGKFGLPFFNNDQLRYEVREDLLVDNINVPHALAEFERRLTKRLDEFLATGRPIIIDGSVDRRWPERKAQLQEHGYGWFLINMELSRPFLENLFSKTGRADWTGDYLDRYFPQHEEFMRQHSWEINLQITDETFPKRLRIAADTLQKFIDSLDGGPKRGTFKHLPQRPPPVSHGAA